ncbi:MAG TPA: DUF4232 domain-containing protein [Umezawaea sp.]|nr:DUF4232 domain-containing protein [Umezawaea sp.]
MRNNNGRVVRGAVAVTVLAAFGALTACSAGQTGTPGAAGDVKPPSSSTKQAQVTTGVGGTRVTGGPDALKANGAKPSNGEQFCATAEVELGDEFPALGTEGQVMVPILLTNDSSVRCTIQGFPGVQFQKDNGESMDLVRSDVPIKPVSLEPRQQTDATLVFMGASTPEGTAPWAPDSVLITPPNTADTQRVPWTFGSIVRQDGATHPGSFVNSVDAVDWGHK